MSPNEKAEELVSRYRKEILKGKYGISGFVIEELAEECALISADEILYYATRHGFINLVQYWNEVKQEIIEKL